MTRTIVEDFVGESGEGGNRSKPSARAASPVVRVQSLRGRRDQL